MCFSSSLRPSETLRAVEPYSIATICVETPHICDLSTSCYSSNLPTRHQVPACPPPPPNHTHTHTHGPSSQSSSNTPCTTAHHAPSFSVYHSTLEKRKWCDYGDPASSVAQGSKCLGKEWGDLWQVVLVMVLAVVVWEISILPGFYKAWRNMY